VQVQPARGVSHGRAQPRLSLRRAPDDRDPRPALRRRRSAAEEVPWGASVKLSDRIYLVGSGGLGFDLSDPFDCHVYLLDGGGELALVDVGAGMGAEAIVENVRREGLDPRRIRHLILTHAHGDHAGGAARMRLLASEAAVYISHDRAQALRE